MANTTTSTVSEPVGQYYESRFLMRAEENFVLEPLGMPGRIPKHRGNTVVWNRFTNPSAKTSALTEATDPTPTGLSATLVSATLSQYGNYERVSDILDLTAADSVVEEAIDLLAYEAALSIDTIIANTIVSGGTQQLANTAAHRTSVAETDTMSVTEVRKAVRTLTTFAAPKHTADRYVAVAHPDVVYDLQGDSNWTNAHIYTEKGINAVYNGEVGELYGVRFLQSQQTANILTNSGSANAEVYITHIMGKGFFGVSKLQDLTTYVDSPSRNLVLRHGSDVGWKAAFAEAVLNDSFDVRVESGATQS